MQIKSILIVDDEPFLRSFTNEVLTSEGYTCLEAANGLEASKLIQINNFDLLITDFRMPIMDGPKLLQWCRDHNKHFPVIFISGNLELLPVEEVALKDCCAQVIRKPIGIEELLLAVNKAKESNHHQSCG